MATYEPFIWPIPTSKVVKVPKLFRTLLSLIFTAPFPSELGFAPLLDDGDELDGKLFDKITEEECSVVAINAAKLGEIAFKARDFHESTSKCPPAHAPSLKILSTYILLLFHPSSSTHYNLRRTLLLTSPPSVLKGELYLTSLILIRSGKSSPTWSYRKDVLNLLLNHPSTPVVSHPSILSTELNFVTRIIKYYPKNYYAFNHRRYVLLRSPSLLELDLEVTLEELKMNNSDNSRVAHIDWLLDNVKGEVDLEGVLERLEGWGGEYPEAETIWRAVRAVGLRVLKGGGVRGEVLRRWWEDCEVIGRGEGGRKGKKHQESRLKAYLWCVSVWVRDGNGGEVEGRMGRKIRTMCLKELGRREQVNEHLDRLKDTELMNF
ncbi:hypothetical protein TrVE_jg4988 [Triparma verrucosa]|uniref:Uncharacterized protein n=1 Tax=Triparma verrucosa TaxID=1606542 RepID=A0A9W7CD62_9STRA|nr:hypothetical protein TrVE_jg4988 [Triparma verrucosa]